MREGFVVEANRLHNAGAEVVDHDVGSIDQAHQDFAALGFLDRNPDAFLRSIGGEEEIAVVTLGVAAVAQFAARIFDRLDLEDFGAVIAEDLRAERTGQVAREIDDLDSRKRRRGCIGWFNLFRI